MNKPIFSILRLIAASLITCFFMSCLNQHKDVHQQWLDFSELDSRQQLQYWEEDIDYFLQKLEKKHVDCYASLSQEDFRNQVLALKSQLPDLSNRQRFGEILRLTALLNHSSTRAVSSFSMEMFPFRLQEFEEGIYIIAATEEYSSLLGSRLEMIGSSNVEQVLPRLKPFISASNEVDLRYRQVQSLSCSAMLHLAGVIDSPEKAVITLLDPQGERRTLLVEVGEPSAELIYQSDLSEGPDRLWLNGDQDPYRLEFMEDSGLIFFQYNRSEDSESYPVEQVVEQIRSWERNKEPRFLLIDLRYNTGGDLRILKPLLRYLEDESSLNRRGHLFVAIGRITRGTAIINAINLEKKTSVIFIGEPTGEKPNFMGDTESFLLPNTGIRVFYPTKIYYLRDRQTEFLEPQILISYSFEDYRNGVDPLLQLLREN